MKKSCALVLFLSLLAGVANASPPPPNAPDGRAARVGKKGKKQVEAVPPSGADPAPFAAFEEIGGLTTADILWSAPITNQDKVVERKYVTDSKRDAVDEEVVVVVEHPSSGTADQAKQDQIDDFRRISVKPRKCAKNVSGACRSARILIKGNATNGTVYYVRAQGLLRLEELKEKLDSMTKDTDGDGIKDIVDQCVNEAAGLNPDPTRLGCPIHDADKDGIADAQDRCPTEPGPKENQGCPEKKSAAVTAPPPPPVVPTVEPAPAPTPAPAAPAVAAVPAPKTESTLVPHLYGRLRFTPYFQALYLAPIGLSDRVSPLLRGGGAGVGLCIEGERLNGSKWGMRSCGSGGLHPFVYGKENVMDYKSVDILVDLGLMFHPTARLALILSGAVYANHNIAEGTRAYVGGCGEFSMRYANERKSGVYLSLDAILCGGKGAARGYPEQSGLVAPGGMVKVGYQFPMTFRR